MIRRTLAAAAIALLGLLFQAQLVKTPRIGGDQLLYLGLASALHETGRFEDAAPAAARPGGRPPQITVAPLYPALLALVMTVDARLAATARCWAAAQPDCPGTPRDLGLLQPIQFALAVLCLLILWRAAAAVTRSEAVAWVALVVAAFGCYEYAGFARAALTETLAALLALAFSYHLYRAVDGGGRGHAAAAGIALGLAGLTRPQFVYLAYAVAALVAAAALVARRRVGTPLLAKGAVLSLACAAVLLPWLLRNWLVIGSFELTHGYGARALSHRLAFDGMSLADYVAGWVCFLPDFGASAARALDWGASCHRLGLGGGADTFYAIGSDITYPETMAAAGGPAHHMRYLILHGILGDLPRYAAVTLLLAWRGLWVGKYFSVICAPLLAAALLRGLRRRENALLLFAAPALFLLLLQAAVSISIPRYNIYLIPAMSIAAALAFHGIAQWILGRWTARAKQAA
jgi:4-amino-4-deoxy-L-arabinose transferase-like glycosyltransferase